MTATDNPTVPGWVGIDPDTPELDAQRAYLSEHNGIRGLDIVGKDEITRAVKIFHRDGFVVIDDVLAPEQLASVKAGVDEAVADIVAVDPEAKGNRMSHRYSFGGSSSTRSMLHRPAWQELLQIEFVHEIITAIFESDRYMLRSASGDFCLPGAVGYQPLHSDMGTFRPVQPSPYASFYDQRGLLNIYDLPTPYIAVNFLMVDATPLNGPTRQIPGTQNIRTPIPTLDEEPEWMRLSTVCPATAGSIQIRDVRAWHGGTPNLSDHVRAIPNLEFYAPWFREPIVDGITRADWAQLSDQARAVTKFSVADPADDFEPTVGLFPLY